MAQKAGSELQFQDLDELPQVVVQGIREDRFIMMIGTESIGSQMRERAGALEQGARPVAHRLGG